MTACAQSLATGGGGRPCAQMRHRRATTSEPLGSCAKSRTMVLRSPLGPGSAPGFSSRARCLTARRPAS
eukprot:4051333-Alexandrium_andersonii.AAC.1